MKNKFLLGLYFLVLFIYSAAPVNYVMIGESSPIISSLFPVILGLIVAVQCNISLLKRSMLLLMSVLTIWNIAIYDTLHRIPSPYPYISLFVAYIAFHAFRHDFAKRFVKTTVALTMVSLVVWFLSLVVPSIMKSFAMEFGIPSNDVSYSFILFNISYKIGEQWLVRNPGFCWEPGRYSCFLVIAMFFYLLQNGLNFKTRKFWILAIGLASTFSTTGYAMFLALIFLWVIYEHKLNPLYIVPVIFLIAIVWNLPFMEEKLMALQANEDTAMSSIDMMVYQAQHGSDRYYTPQRLQGLVLQWINLRNMPLLTGEGRNLTLHFINRTYGVNFALSEGVLGVLVRYGLVLGFFIYFCLFKSSMIFSKMGKQSFGVLFLVIYMMANISYYFWESPLFVVMWCWYLFSKDIKQPQGVRRYGTKTAYINNNSVLQ